MTVAGALGVGLSFARVINRVPRVIVSGWASCCLVAMVGLPTALCPPLVLRGLVFATAWFALATSVAMAFDDDAHVYRVLELCAFAVAATAVIGILQIFRVIPSPVGSPSELPGVSTLGNQNYLAELCAIVLWPSILVTMRTRGWRFWRSCGVSVVLVLAIFACRATGAILSVIASGGVLMAASIVYMTRHWRRVPTVMAAIVLVGCVTAGAALLSYCRTLDHLAGWAGVNAEVTRLSEANNGTARLTNWAVALDQFKLRPVTGVGLENFQAAWIEGRARLSRTRARSWYAVHVPRAHHAHNDYLQWTSETGTVGALWLCGMACAMIMTWRRRFLAEATPWRRYERLILGVSAITAGVIALVSFPTRLPASFCVLAILCGLALRHTDPQRMECASAGRWRKPGNVRRMRIAAATVGALVIIGTWRELSADMEFVRGERAFTGAQYATAARHLKRGCEWTFWPGQRRYLWAVCELQRGNVVGARKLLEAGIVEEPTYQQILQLAELEVDAGDLNAATRRVDTVLACGPTQDHVLSATLLAGRIEQHQGRYQEAARLYEQAISMGAHFYPAMLARGHLEALRGDDAEARRWYLIAIEELDNLARLPANPHRAQQLAGHRRVAVTAIRSLRAM